MIEVVAGLLLATRPPAAVGGHFSEGVRLLGYGHRISEGVLALPRVFADVTEFIHNHHGVEPGESPARIPRLHLDPLGLGHRAPGFHGALGADPHYVPSVVFIASRRLSKKHFIRTRPKEDTS